MKTYFNASRKFVRTLPASGRGTGCGWATTGGGAGVATGALGGAVCSSGWCAGAGFVCAGATFGGDVDEVRGREAFSVVGGRAGIVVAAAGCGDGFSSTGGGA